jgi:DHA2 family multidrug resistance protein
MLSINSQVHQSYLSAHFDAFRLSALTAQPAMSTDFGASILRKGPEPLLGMVYLQMQRQASVLSYIDDFRFLSYLFYALTPLVFLMRRPQTSGPPAAAH